MYLSPAGVFLSWIRGLTSLVIVLGALGMLLVWFASLPISIPEQLTSEGQPGAIRQSQSDRGLIVDRSGGLTRSPLQRLVAWRPGFDRSTALVTTAVLLLIWSFSGHYAPPARFFLRKAEPIPKLTPGTVQLLVRPDGAEIHMETRGPENAPIVILIHGWSLNSDQWVFLLREWGEQFRVVTWDLAGLGKSTASRHRNFSLETMAGDLEAVIEACEPGPVVLVGHSIGGMILLTFSRLFPKLLGTRVSKMILVHTTYTNPLRTMAMTKLFTTLQKPVVEPLLYLQIWISPLAWILNWMGYWNGTLHISASQTGFMGRERWSELDYIASFYPHGSPAIVARGALEMLKFDETDVLRKIDIPVLIVCADQDPITLCKASELMAAQILNSRLLILKPARHFGFVEHKTDFARKTAEFIWEKTTNSAGINDSNG